MLSCIQVCKFSYNERDFNFTVKSAEDTANSFDSILRQKWKQAEEAGLFRYILNIRSNKTLKGKYRFLLQLNPERTHCRRVPESITSMSQVFNYAGFNFTKLIQREILLDIGNGDGNDVIAINNSPMERYHCLILTERFKCLPQIMTKYSLRKAIELCLLSTSWSLRVIFNSLCASASVNHLHWHLYDLSHEMLLEYIDVCKYARGVYSLMDYPARGWCVKLSSLGNNIDSFVSQTFLVVSYLQARLIAHNVYITRAKLKADDDLYADVRIYIWARKSVIGIKNTTALIPAVCELFGHLPIKDERMYDSLKEKDVTDVLRDVTDEIFSSIENDLQRFLKENVTGDISEIFGQH